MDIKDIKDHSQDDSAKTKEEYGMVTEQNSHACESVQDILFWIRSNMPPGSHKIKVLPWNIKTIPVLVELILIF